VGKKSYKYRGIFHGKQALSLYQNIRKIKYPPFFNMLTISGIELLHKGTCYRSCAGS
jgi:hypothetical protein